MSKTQSKRKEPMRQCVGCMEKKPKKQLIRIVRTPAEEIRLDRTGKISGRGVYVCPHTECLAKAQNGKRLERSLSCRVPVEVYDSLQEEMKRGNG